MFGGWNVMYVGCPIAWEINPGLRFNGILPLKTAVSGVIVKKRENNGKFAKIRTVKIPPPPPTKKKKAEKKNVPPNLVKNGSLKVLEWLNLKFYNKKIRTIQSCIRELVRLNGVLLVIPILPNST